MTTRAFEALPTYPPVTYDWDAVRQRLAAGEILTFTPVPGISRDALVDELRSEFDQTGLRLDVRYGDGSVAVRGTAPPPG
jgi:hypothetical protein